MNKGLLSFSVLLLAISLACITTATVQVLQDAWGIWSVHFLGSAAFHAITAAAGAMLMMKAVPVREEPAVGEAES